MKTAQAMSGTLARLCAVALVGLLFTSSASAHYLWVTIDPTAGDHGTTNVYFEGGAGPGDGRYNDPFVTRGKTWIQTPNSEKPLEVKMKDTTQPGKRWLSGALPKGSPRSVTSYGKWGVYRYGKTDVLLHYYSKLIDAKADEDFYQLARSKQLSLDVVPVQVESGYALRVLWKGEPVEGRPVQVRGPGGFKASPKTDKDGLVRFEAEVPGRFTVKTTVEQKEDGEFEEKTYQLIRHNFTMLLTFPKEG